MRTLFACCLAMLLLMGPLVAKELKGTFVQVGGSDLAIKVDGKTQVVKLNGETKLNGKADTKDLTKTLAKMVKEGQSITVDVGSDGFVTTINTGAKDEPKKKKASPKKKKDKN